MQITKTLLLSTILVSLAAQYGEARPIRNLVPAEPSVVLDLSVLSALTPEFPAYEPAPEQVKPKIKKKKLKPVAGTENSPKIKPQENPKQPKENAAANITPVIAYESPPEIKPKPEAPKLETKKRRPAEQPVKLPPPTNLLPETISQVPTMPNPMVVEPPPAPSEMLEIPKPPMLKPPELKIPPKIPQVENVEAKPPELKIPDMPVPPPAPSAATGEKKIVQLPPLNFDDEPQKAPPATKAASLPPVNNLFAENGKAQPPIELPPVPAKPIPAPLVIAQNETKPAIPALPAEPKVGKPVTDTVMIDSPKLPPVITNSATAALTIPLTAVENELPVSREADVSALAAKLNASPKAIITIKSYAAGTEEQSSQAKRTSLARALSVRKYLMEKEGVKSDRISVRPMGNKNEGGVPDRIDLFLENISG